MTSRDHVTPFMIETSNLRGRVVRLGPAVETILQRHNYPRPVSLLLGELLVLTTMLGASLKFDGIFTMQAKGDGPVKFMVADCTSNGEIRGYAEVDKELYALEEKAAPQTAHTLAGLLGKGYLAVTIDQGGERYQGIVELKGEKLTDAVLDYFRQSEQLEVALKIAVGESISEASNDNAGRWYAGGIMIQRLPVEEARRANPAVVNKPVTPEEFQDAWNRAGIFLETASREELIDPSIPPKELLYRLFHEEGVWVYDPKPVAVACRCSRPRVSDILKTLPREELKEMEVEGKITVTCKFCNKDEVFSRAEVDKLFTEPKKSTKAKKAAKPAAAKKTPKKPVKKAAPKATKTKKTAPKKKR